MAAIAIMIKNLLKFFSGAKNEAETPKWVARVVIILARINHSIKKGKILTENEINYIVSLIMTWIKREYDKNREVK